MNKQKGFDILFLLESLEYYIEKLGVYPNFKQKQQLRNRVTPEEVLKKCSLEDIEDSFRTQLIIFLACVMDKKIPPENNVELRKEQQEEFHQWLNHTGIRTDNCPPKLKHFLLEIEDICEKQSDKIFEESCAYLWRKEKEKLVDPKEVSNFFKDISGIMVNPPQMYHLDMKGNAREGKKLLAEIANSLSTEERENFHFYPPFTEQERTEYEKEQKEGKEDPIIKGQRLNAIEEIKTALKKEPRWLVSSDLEPENQDWENKINRAEKIIEIENIKRQVLADIEKKKCPDCQKINEQTRNSTDKFPANWVIFGGVVVNAAILGMLILWNSKKSREREREREENNTIKKWKQNY